MDNKKRALTIDIAKGISIALVALNHSAIPEDQIAVTDTFNLFRLPLFFFLSGIFFSSYASTGKFLLKKSDALLKPYFVILALLAFLDFLLNDKSMLQPLLGILWGGVDSIRWTAMWFLPHLFAVFCAAYVVERLITLAPVTRHQYIRITLAVILLACGPAFIDAFAVHYSLPVSAHRLKPFGLPFSLDILPVTLGFFLLGKAFKTQLVDFTPMLIPFICCLVVFVVINAYSSADIKLAKRLLNEPVFALIGAMAGIYLVLSVSYAMSKVRAFYSTFTLMGRTSLYILIFHSVVNTNVFNLLYPRDGELAEYRLPIAVIAYFASLIVPVLMWLVAKRIPLVSHATFPLQSKMPLWPKSKQT